MEYPFYIEYTDIDVGRDGEYILHENFRQWFSTASEAWIGYDHQIKCRWAQDVQEPMQVLKLPRP